MARGTPLNAVKKGDIVAIQVEHSSTDAKMKTTRYTAFLLGRVTAASRDGWTKTVMLSGCTHSVEVARLGKVMTFPAQYRDAAARLCPEGHYAGVEYASCEELKNAIRNA